MSTLTAKQRKAIPTHEFGLMASRKYPMPDKAHAANAKARATQMQRRGKLSPQQAAEIRAKADKMLGADDQDGDE